MIELCAGSGLLMAVFAGVFDLGYTLLQYNKLFTAVAAGARYGSAIPYDSATATPSAAFVAAVQNMVIYGDPASGATPIVAGLTTGEVQVTVTFNNGIPSAVSVSVVGYGIRSVFGAHTLSGKPAASFPYHGVWAPA
jgi:hypothetical protein